MIEAEHRFRIKRGGGAGCRHPSATTSNASPCPRDKLEDVAWNKPDSKTLERLVWSVYDRILSPGPTPKLTGPESYNQVTRHLTSKVFRGCKCTVQHVHWPNLMSQPQSRCAQLSSLYPQAGCQKSRRLPRPWTRLLIKSTQQKRELWEGRRKRTQMNIRWRGCAIVRTLIVMKWSTSGLYSAHSRMAGGQIPGVLCVICCPLGNGWLPLMLHPALPPQATWR